MDQIIKYNEGMLSKDLNPAEVGAGERGIFWDRGRPGIVFGNYAGVTFDKFDPRVLVGILSHEIGHYINDARAQAREQYHANEMRNNCMVMQATTGFLEQTAWMRLHACWPQRRRR
ncbi:hypothetical protein [Burkholderia orbicola]|uniref:hypothetical protein n=1 Tax=Burkholderia orbicola TaxID=2978683 RepID=UPI00115FBFA9